MKNLIIYFINLLFLFFLTCCDRKKSESVDSDLMELARKMAKEIIIIDTHIDVPYRLYNKMEDISQKTERGDFDFPRAVKGGLNVPFMSIYVPASLEGTDRAKLLADTLIDMVKNFTYKWPDKFVLVTSVNDVYNKFDQGRLLLAMGMENGSPINGDIRNLEYFYNRGIRYITLAHSKNNHICDSSYEKERLWKGLSPFGKAVISEMNRLGIMIDVSHVSDSSFYQIIRLSKAPVIASHSSCRHFTPGWERNMSDDMIHLLGKKGGVIQINFGSSFISDSYRNNFEPMWAYIEDHNMKYSEQSTREYINRYVTEHPINFADAADVADHIDHIKNIAGIDYVGIGSDFDGLGNSLPTGLKDVSFYPNLIYHLLKKKYTEEEIKKVCAGNLLRVWTKVEKVAKEIQVKSDRL